MGTLYVIATPIGNLEDATFRAVRLLGTLDALACEDTRHTAILLDRYNIARPPVVFSCHEHNEERAAEHIVELLDQNRKVGLVTNAGYPCVSDPGYRAVSRAAERGHRVEVIPGAGAVETALAASGLPTSSFTFRGFPPKKSGKRRNFIAEDREPPHTLVFFESPLRTGEFLKDALAVLGDRKAAVCVELTKAFEQVHRGYLSELAARFADAEIKGEVTIVIAGNHPKFIQNAPDEEDERSE